MSWVGRCEAKTSDFQRPTVVDNQFLITYEDWTNFTRFRNDERLFEDVQTFRSYVGDRYEVIKDYEYLSMYCVQCSEKDLASLKHVPRFRFATRIQFPIEDYHPILKALDALRNQTCFQLFQWFTDIVKPNNILPNDYYEGGLWPAGDYPTSEYSKLITADPHKEYSSPPAWMPVINLSLGPYMNDEFSPVFWALDTISQTHLVTIAAGNDGMASGPSNVNSWAPFQNILRVGATDDEAGNELATYSSTGIAGDTDRVPDVVAYGDSQKTPGKRGTSFAAPRVAMLGCIGLAAVFQISRVVKLAENEASNAGIPIVGWGVVDKAEEYGFVGIPRREIPGLPFMAVNESLILEAIGHLKKRDAVRVSFEIWGGPLRMMIVDSAKPVGNRAKFEVGNGFVCESAFLDFVANQPLEYFLKLFCGEVELSHIPARLRHRKVFLRDELGGLATIVKETMPTWFYDYEKVQFSVNGSRGGTKIKLPPTGSSHAFDVISSGRFSK